MFDGRVIDVVQMCEECIKDFGTFSVWRGVYGNYFVTCLENDSEFRVIFSSSSMEASCVLAQMLEDFWKGGFYEKGN